MRSASQSMRNFARRLLALEAPASTQDAKEPAAFVVCEKLRISLTRMAGSAGFRSLLARALALAGNEVLWLKALRVGQNGSLEGLEEIRLPEEEKIEGEVVLIAQLLELLVTFIGEALTLRLARDAWPNAALGSLNSDLEKDS